VGKPEGKRPLRRPECRWEDNVKLDLRELGWGGMNWTDLAEDRDHWRAHCEHSNELFGFIRCSETLQ
jgi:hypothetical protein